MNIQLLETEHCRIIIAEITEDIEELLPLLENYTSYENQFKQINASKRKKEFISVRFLMNILMQKNVIIAYNTVHKPYLINSEHTISISHSGNYFALIVSLNGGTGIDIECRTNRVYKVRERYLDTNELEFIMLENQNTRALEIAWTAKEALFKIIGSEAYDFHTLKICPFQPDQEGTLEATHEPSKRKFNLHYIQNQEYTIAYCIDKN